MVQYAQFVDFVILSFLAAAAINDIRKREVPNWVNYGLVVTGVGLSSIWSIVTLDWHPIAFCALGGLASYGLAALMFYTGQWGGGDSKLLIGLGTVMGLPFSLHAPYLDMGSQLIAFLSNFVVVSLIYAIFMGAFFALRNRKQFVVAFKRQMERYGLVRRAMLFFSAAGLIVIILVHDFVIRLGIAVLLVSSFVGVYLSIMAKAVESSCMVKKVNPGKLTEGDWILKDVVVDGKRICGPKDLGVEKSQIRKLIELYNKRKIKFVEIKEGIPFAPSFLLTFILTLAVGNLFLLFL
jgi:Flp pilus assembly protein protease CpaA